MTPGAPIVYFIDDSATMREVIKIAFRRENINVVACHDAANALSQMDQMHPDVIISDVIMPDQDGYQVCEYIKQHPRLGKTPVILMSGVVNRAVAERAFSVKADELIRKPFQPQDLIARVRQLLAPRAPAAPPAAATSANAALSSIFATPSANLMPMARPPIQAPAARTAVAAMPRPTPAPLPSSPNTAAAVARAPMASPLGNAMPAPAVPVSAPVPAAVAAPPVPAVVVTPAPAAPPAAAGAEARSAAPMRSASNLDVQKMKVEIMRLEGLVRKLQSELEAEREYSRALEDHVKTLQEAE
jgi:CheY-like chemotaxis protein